MSEDARNANFIEVVKHVGHFRRHFGPWLGAVLYVLTMIFSRPKAFRWRGPLAVGALVGGLVLKYGLPTFG